MNNLPLHQAFCLYHRCPFHIIQTEASKLGSTVPVENGNSGNTIVNQHTTTAAAGSTLDGGSVDSKLVVPSASSISVTISSTTASAKKSKVKSAAAVQQQLQQSRAASMASPSATSPTDSKGIIGDKSKCISSLEDPLQLVLNFYDNWETMYAKLRRWYNSDSATSNLSSSTHQNIIHDSAAVQLAPDLSPYHNTKLYAYPEVSKIG